MSYIPEMSTDADITNTQVSQGFPLPYTRYNWQQILQGNLNISDQAVIVVKLFRTIKRAEDIS